MYKVVNAYNLLKVSCTQINCNYIPDPSTLMYFHTLNLKSAYLKHTQNQNTLTPNLMYVCSNLKNLYLCWCFHKNNIKIIINSFNHLQTRKILNRYVYFFIIYLCLQILFYPYMTFYVILS